MDASGPVESLSAWRKKEDISQAELARRLGVSTASVSLWLRGLTVPDGESAYAIESLTKIPASSWFGPKRAPVRIPRARRSTRSRRLRPANV